MDLKELNAPIDINDIDFRVQSVNKGKYAIILAYKDARYDMNILDSVVGADKWQKEYRTIDGRLYCRVGVDVSDEGNEPRWVWKEDVGTESNAEAEKGQASDAFKRACFNWGIGRELYDFPVISVKLKDTEVKPVGEKYQANYNLKLKQWDWGVKRDESGRITQLAAKDEGGKLRFNWKRGE